jgi:hypothetical protein
VTLLALQRDLRNWLDRGDEDAASRFPAEAAPGLRVYQNNYRAQLIACLEASFPHSRAWIGGSAFHDAVVAHIERVPPSSWTLDAYPRDFPTTLASLYPDDPEIAELADLELALGEAFVAKDAAPIAADQLGEIDWDHAVPAFTPSLYLRGLTTNALAIWCAIDAGIEPPAADMLPLSAALIVWRHDGLSRFRAADQREMDAILRCRAGMNYGTLCAQIIDEMGEEDGIAAAGGWLGQWIREGLIVAIA